MARLHSTRKGAFGRIFQDRQLLIRSEQGVSHLYVRGSFQLAVVGVVAGLFIWGLSASFAYRTATWRIAEQAGQITDLEIGYARLITDMSDRQGGLSGVAGAAEAIDAGARRVIARNDSLEGRIAALQVALARSETARAEEVETARILRARISGLERDLEVLEDGRDELERKNADLAATVDDLSRTRDELSEEKRQLRVEIARLERSLAEAEMLNEHLDTHIDELTVAVQDAVRTVEQLADERETLRASLADARSEIRAGEVRAGRLQDLLYASYRAAIDRWQERNALADQNGSLRARAAELESELVALRLSQEALFAELRARTDVHVAAIEKGLSFTGLDIDELIDQLRSDLTPGSGGPLIPADPDAGPATTAADAVDLVSLVGRAAALRGLVNRLPLAVPVRDRYRLSSGFGTRRDPFTGRKSSHEGLDFAARSKTPVHATAPGTVAFAGRNGAYGNVVDIDHGFGVVTRYAHLNRVDVAVGQVVASGERIGLLGSTGRSTGPHLHYEVLVDGAPRNPANFLKAGEHVFQIADD